MAKQLHLMPKAIKSNILIAALAILTVLFFIGGPGYYSPRSFKAFWNLGHIVYYALLAVAIFKFSPPSLRRFSVQISIAISAAIILGLMVELLQANFQRTPDAGDLYRNIIGAIFGILFLSPLPASVSNKLLRFFQILTMVLIAHQVYPLAAALTDEHQSQTRFPILSDFENPGEIQRWAGSADFGIDNDISHTGKGSMRVTMNTDLYSGVSLNYFPGNWIGYSYLQFNIFNPTPSPLSITCRIHDHAHTLGPQPYQDRFNQRFSLHQGWNTITIALTQIKNAPADRKMDLSHIQNIGIFATELPAPRKIYIDDVMLKKDKKP